MRKSGLPTGRKADIPFGVRAIQTGVEVDGIWISRPGTPTESEDFGNSTLIGSVSDTKVKDKPSPLAGGLRKPTTAVIEVEPTPNQSPTPSLLERSDAYTPSPLRISQLGSQSTYKPTQSSQKPLAPAPESTHLSSLEQLEGTRAPRLETYVPTSPYQGEQSTAYTPMRRRSSASYDEDDDYTQEDVATPASRYQDRPLVPPPRRPSPFDDPEISTPTPIADMMQRDGYLTGTETSPEYTRNTLDRGSGESGTDRGHNPQSFSHRIQSSYGSMDSRVPQPPRRSYSGETHVNTSSRRVNAGFEVLPAGTFSSRPRSRDDVESTHSNRSRNRIPPVTNRLHKKAYDRP